VLSIVEDIVAVGALVLAAVSPLAILVVIGVFLLLLAWILPKVVRRIRRMIQSVRMFFTGSSLREAARS
jgi:hypothetical protein